MPSSDDVSAEISELADLDRVALAARWTLLTGRPPPKRSTVKLLALALAYEIQLRSSKQSQDVEALVDKALARSTSTLAPAATPRRLSPGARLLREWRGSTLVVDVIDGGYVFEGDRYASLSAIARKATGVVRNGPAFFGLRDRGGG
jgi:hypothetical protein